MKEQAHTGPVRRTHTVEEAARILGVGRNAAYEAVRRGDIPSIKIGARIVIPRAAIERMLDVAGPEKAA